MPTADGGLAERISGLGRFAVRLSWPFRPALLDAVWAAFSAVNLVAIFAFAGWETVPFHFIWISFTLVYGFRTWAPRPTLAVLGAVMATTGAAIGVDVARGTESVAELTEVPLMAAMFLAMVWHARRKLTAEQESRRFGEENARLLATQRRFLQDASHQLRTPITIALGHAELLADGLAGRQEGHDIEVVLGELNRLRRIAERLLVIAAAEGPSSSSPKRSSWTASPWRSCTGGGPPPIAAGSSAGWTRSPCRPTGSGSAWPSTRCWRTRSGTPPAGTSSSSPWSRWATGCRFA